MELKAAAERYQKMKIGVLMGGMSSERDVSLRSGENVYRALKNLGLNAVKIDVTKDVGIDLKKEAVDLAFIALHGRFGEDGAIQGLLEIMGIPYTGPGIIGSSIGMNKALTKKVLSESGIPVPKAVAIDANHMEKCIQKIEKEVGFPVILKPNNEGSSIGVQLIKDKKSLTEGIQAYTEQYPDSFAEQYVKGREITIGVINDGERVTVMPVLELKPKNEFYDLEAKYTKGMTDFEIPAKIKKEKLSVIENHCIRAYKELCLNGVVRFDAILDSDENPFFLEVNTIPGMTDTSDIPAIAKAGGMQFEEIVLKILGGSLGQARC